MNNQIPSIQEAAAVCKSGLALLRDKRFTVPTLHNWYVVCGRQKLRTRVQRITKIWPNVLDTLKNYTGALIDKELGDVELDTDGFIDHYRARFPELVDGQGYFVYAVNSSTASGWTKLIAYILERLEKQLEEQFCHKGDADVARMRSVTRLVYELHVISRSPAIAQLFTLNELSTMHAVRIGKFLSLPRIAQC